MQIETLAAVTRSLTVNGAMGYVRVAAPNPFAVGQLVNLAATGLAATGLRVNSISGFSGTSDIAIFLVDFNNLAFDASAYTVGGGATITGPAQTLWLGLALEGNSLSGILNDNQFGNVLSRVLPGGSATSPIIVANPPSSLINLFNRIDPTYGQYSPVVDISAYKTLYLSWFFDNITVGGSISGSGLFWEMSNEPNNPLSWAPFSSVTSVNATLNSFTGSTTLFCTNRWFRVAYRVGNNNISQVITCVADVNGNLAGKYFLLGGFQSSSTWPQTSELVTPEGDLVAVWLRVSGVGVSPGRVVVGGRTYEPTVVDISTNDSAATVASKIGAALSNQLGIGAIILSTSYIDNYIVHAVPARAAVGFPAYGNGLYLIYSAPNVNISTDGINWETHTGGTVPVALNHLVFGNGLFVGVGAAGLIVTSPDGVNWTTQTSGIAIALNCIRYNGSYFIALPNSGTLGCKSTNGTTWTNPTITNAIWFDLAWNGNIWVAVASSGTTAMSSTDGVNWTPRTIPSGAYIAAAAVPGGAFVAHNNSTLLVVSPDGINWFTSISPGNFTSITRSCFWDSVNNVLHVCGSSSNYFTSIDGYAWAVHFAGSKLNSNCRFAIGPSSTILAAVSNSIFLAIVVGGAKVILNNSATGGCVPAQDVNTGFNIVRQIPAPTNTIKFSLNLMPI